MKRKLLRQIANEWRSNLWLAIELLVVSVVMWYITDYLATRITVLNIPMGIETDNCFLADVTMVPSSSDSYDPADSTRSLWADDARTIVRRLRSNPDVEAVALATHYSIPYTQNSNSQVLVEDSNGPDTLRTSYVPLRVVSPDYARVLRVRGVNGESPDEIAGMIERDEWLLGANLFYYTNAEARDTTLTEEFWNNRYKESITSDKSNLIGRRFLADRSGDSISHRIGAIIQPLKRHEYETPNGGVLMKLDESDDAQILSSQMLIRVKPEAYSTFADNVLLKSSTFYRAGNIFLSSVVSLESMRKEVQNDSATMVRNFVVVMLFLMVSIFLGLLGTFWFRTQQRVSEIAVRMVNGATRGEIFRRLISEGLLLLTIVTPLAALCDWLLCHYEMSNHVYWFDYFDLSRYIITVVATYLLMALMIVLGIWFPASRAMKIEPAIALKDE